MPEPSHSFLLPVNHRARNIEGRKTALVKPQGRGEGRWRRRREAGRVCPKGGYAGGFVGHVSVHDVWANSIGFSRM